MQYTHTHLKKPEKKHTYPSTKQWTVIDLQESPDHSVTPLQNGLGKPYHWVKKQRRQLRLEMSLNNDIAII